MKTSVAPDEFVSKGAIYELNGKDPLIEHAFEILN